MRVHKLKIRPKYFKDVISGKKNFEIRYNDRNFKEGDIVVLEEYDDKLKGGYTGRFINTEITYLFDDLAFNRLHYVTFAFKLRLDRGCVI